MRGGRELTGQVARSRGGDAPLDDDAIAARCRPWATRRSPGSSRDVRGLADLPDLTPLLDLIARAADADNPGADA
jgi:hypothetical protein